MIDPRCRPSLDRLGVATRAFHLIDALLTAGPCDFVEWDGVYKMSYTTWFGGQESHYARVYGSGDDRVAVLSNGWVLRGPHWGKYPSETDDIMVCKHCNRVLET